MIQKSSNKHLRILYLVLIPVVLLAFSIKALPVQGDDQLTEAGGTPTITELGTTSLDITETSSPATLIPETSESSTPTSKIEEQELTLTPEISNTDTPSVSPTIPIETETSEELVTILVKVKPGMEGHINSAYSGKYSLSVDPILESVNIALVEVPVSKKKEAIDHLRALPGVEFAEGEKQIHALDFVPNDPFLERQYALTSIHAYSAWGYLPPSDAAPIIAIIDTGIDLGHPEFSGRLLPGYDFQNEDAIPQDDNGHGSHVAGIAAGGGNNATGIAGICWDAQIIPIKVLDSSGDGTYSNVARGIIWAVDRGAEIINLSLGATPQSQTLEDAVNYAIERGVILVAATGNAGMNGVFYPAAYPGVVAVAAVDQENKRAVFSNYGPQVDLSAPGVSIYSTIPGGSYSYRSGTSMSAPMVTGSIALISELFGYSPASSLFILEDTAQDLGVPSKDSYYGYGLIRLDRAAQWRPPTSIPQPDSSDGEPNYPAYGVTTGTGTPLVPSLVIVSPTTTITVPLLVEKDDSKISIVDGTTTPTVTETTIAMQTQSESIEDSANYPWIGWILIGIGIILFMNRRLIVGRVFPPHH